MVDEPEYSRWREDAERAIEAARTQASAVQHNWACFLAEQAAQLSVKALLHGIGAGPRGHDLVKLGRHAAELLESDWPMELEPRLNRLSRLYIPTRYPDAFASGPAAAHFDSSDSEQAIEDAELVMSAVDGLWRRLADD